MLNVRAVMPHITSGVIMQLTLLLSALPAQYLISKWTSGTETQRHIATQRILETWESIRKSYLNTAAWVDWLNTWIPKLPSFGEEEEQYQTLEDANAIELMMHDNEKGYFAVSKEVRSPRPAYVLHRVGQVVMETQNQMVGVIMGWDAGLRAPPEWIKRKKYSDAELERAMDTPHYRIMFTGPDSSSVLIGYIPQYNIKLFQGFQPDIPRFLEHYFSHFDGEKFVMEEWLQEIYPDD
uniref:Si:dkey-261l7.2 n=2 Tax=Cyprinus carpio TaxID=7962 RepID=A0A8C1IL50_CYPCA